MSAQSMDALARANAVRSARSLMLVPLRKGEAQIGDIDLDAPELQSMRVIDFMAALRYNRKASSGRPYKTRSTYRAQTILNRLAINGNRRIRDLSASRKAQLVAMVEATVVAQRRLR